MNQKHIGTILIIISIILFAFVFYAKYREESFVQQYIAEKGTCYLNDGTCLHENNNFLFYLLGGTLIISLLILGIYLLIFDKTQKKLAEHQEIVVNALKEAKQQEVEKDEFQAFLSAFSPEEQKVLLAIREQDGIKQSTLKYRTGISKTSLSLLLKSLEEREIISRKVSGKTYELFLRKKF